MTASFADNEIWHVLIASDDMKRMNVEQLDDAFRLSLVDASTMVWKAGMKTWQSLGAVAGIDDEPEFIAPPPPPRPMARPVPRPPSPTRPPAAAATNFYAVTAPVFAAPLVAPVYTPHLHAPDPYVLPKRRAAIPSEVDFRRSSSGVRWGRWLVALLLVTGGVLGAYRQNLLREGARRLGVEGKYLYGEHRVTAFVMANAPWQVKNALTRLALLPGPNALPAPAPVAQRVAPAPVVATAAAAAVPPEPPAAANRESELKTVSLDSLPVLAAEPGAPKVTLTAAAVAPTPRARTVVAKAEPATQRVAKAEPVTQRVAATPKPAKVEKPEPAAKAVAKPKAKAEPPPPANENPLKAAIRSAIAADAAKAAKNK